MKQFLLVGFVASVLLTPAAAFAQGRADNPNLGHFYMARQQVDITDDAPVVNDRRTNPAAAQQQGALPAQRMALPKAGWQPYSQSLPSYQSSLPKTINGVPPKMPAVQPRSGKAGAYKPPKPAAPAAPQVAKTYAPYKRAADSAPATASAGGLNSSTALQGRMMGATPMRGSALHWSRTR